MRVLWKKDIIGNVVVVLLFSTLLAVYVSLLRYNKASATTFNLVRRKRHTRDAVWGNTDQFAKLNPDMKPFKNGKRRRSPVDVYIVDEHQEVLPYWFEAAKRKIIPKSGNTLIHIDGHSDMAPPFYFPDFPYFRAPRDKLEVKAMMQRNDAFIVGAAMAGLIKRVIWIWPIWDKRNHDAGYYLHQKIDLGVGIVPDPENKNKKQRVFCMCEPNMTNPSVKICRYIPAEEVENEEEADGRIIDNFLCKIRKTIIFEEIREDKAYDKITRGKFLNENENILLDIDEDYYGCTHAVQPLINVNMTMETIKLINSVLEQLICPKSLAHEKMADELLVEVLSLFKKPNHCNKAGKFDSKGLFPCKIDARAKEGMDILTKRLWSSKHGLLACSKRKGTSETMMIDHLLDMFKHMSMGQVRVLGKVGFCLTTTLKSYEPTSDSAFHICHGANVPGESVVLIHNPVNSEIPLRTKVLRKILHTIEPYKPKMTTLCRSVRDGYTPRRLFKQIEHDVVKALNDSFKHVRFNYDEGLLGGKNGWPSRHKTSKNKMTHL